MKFVQSIQALIRQKIGKEAKNRIFEKKQKEFLGAPPPYGQPGPSYPGHPGDPNAFYYGHPHGPPPGQHPHPAWMQPPQHGYPPGAYPPPGPMHRMPGHPGIRPPVSCVVK